MKAVLITFIILFSTAAAFADSSPYDHAPIGVMGDHTHKEGETMISYRYMFMEMDGNRDGTSRLSPQEVLEDFMVTPTEMDMEMHMIGVMFAPSNNLTLMAMFPYIELSMEHLTRMGGNFTTEASGLGDISVTGLYKISDHVHINAGVNLPSGDIDVTDDTPVAQDAQLPYPMQLGSGTFDLKPGITYQNFHDEFAWGAQAIGTIRLGENDNDYTLGDSIEGNVWTAVNITNFVSTSLRAKWLTTGNIDGADPALNPMMIPTADPDRRGGDRLDLGVGVNVLTFGNFRLSAEFLFPVFQDLDGPQLETDWTLVVGAQAAF